MLKVDTLQKQIQQAFEEVLPGALKQAMATTMPEKSKTGEKIIERFANTATDLIAEDLSTRLASAIDYYVKNADIYGTIITTGGPFTQMSMINSSGPLINGKVPNTFGLR